MLLALLTYTAGWMMDVHHPVGVFVGFGKSVDGYGLEGVVSVRECFCGHCWGLVSRGYLKSFSLVLLLWIFFFG